MSNISRVYTVANVPQGPMNLYLGLTAPTSSKTPGSDSNTLTLDGSGQPTSSTGFHAGLIDAPVTLTITEKFNEIMADQFEMGVDVAFDSINIEGAVNIKEAVWANILTYLTANNLATYTSLANSQVLQIGGKQDSSVGMTSLTAISVRRDNTAKFAYWMIFKTYLDAAIQLTFDRKKENVFKLKFHGIADLTRVTGDELAQIVRDR